ncbi:cation:proton antiporter [Companilactobacillus keshanensis]|uniref:cation:proton antiporter n=1 Tax=Companilactobacillus keshanensis TaxID=2486003 RepID=UPI0021F06A2C|nr:sodium:proton antiporter [Companilactobacillus keshanensis]
MALALGAIITPTDAVAVSSITSKVLVPEDAMNTLENESLFNDASGIVAFNLAIAALVTGKFSVTDGINNFLYVFIGGILLGLVLGYIIVAIRIMLINMRVDTPSVIVPYTLLTPFIVYLLAEMIGVSGILAVVATGLIHGMQQDRLRLTTSRLQIVMGTTWSIIASILNGIVFVLLGASLPEVIIHLNERDTGSIGILVGLGIFLYVIMTVMRFLWTQLGFAEIRAWSSRDKILNSAIMALSGVHGTITLAMAFSLPLTLSGHAFTYRNDIIFVAAVVILTSLIVPTLVLPFLLPKKVPNITENELSKAKSEMVRSAVQMIQRDFNDSPECGEVIRTLEGQRTYAGRWNLDREKLDEIFHKTFDIERSILDKMLADGEVTDQEYGMYMRVAEHMLVHNQKRYGKKAILMLKFVFVAKLSLSKKARKRRGDLRKIRRDYRKQNHTREQAIMQNRQMWGRIKEIEVEPYKEVSSYLSLQMTDDNEVETGIVRRAYDQTHRRLSGTRDMENSQNELLIQAFQHEHNFIQAQVASNKYSREVGNELYQQISTDQLVCFQTFTE